MIDWVSVIDWGSAPEWVSGVGTIVAVLFAAIAARAALRANRHQLRQIADLERQNAEAAHDRERLQAGQVAVWIVPNGALLPRVRFCNGSGLPIYDVTVVCHTPVGRTVRHYPVRGPDLMPVVLSRATEDVRVLGEGAGIRTGEDWSQLLDGGYLAVAVGFMDAQGRRWVRDTAGGLTGATDADAVAAHPDLVPTPAGT